MNCQRRLRLFDGTEVECKLGIGHVVAERSDHVHVGQATDNRGNLVDYRLTWHVHKHEEDKSR